MLFFVSSLFISIHAFNQASCNTNPYLMLVLKFLFEQRIIYFMYYHFNIAFEWFRSRYIFIWIISIILPQTSWCFQIIMAIFKQNIHWHHNIYMFCIIYLSIIYFTYAVSEWCTIFKYYTSIITETWPLHWSFKFNLTISVIRSTWIIIYFNPIFVLNLVG